FYAPTNLTGIVGPNGCGKSNIIDAVRWVMGEGSAKVLRGESMSDVIFSGSATRKPVGTATVELVFDNADGRVGAQFASFNEISVRRQVSRDGVSMYFLNGTRCRRKDVRDLFLGTGLGARSYSIIEQGMISQIVEARPEEIREHLEEAAGISRYKERRRETENRIAHTRDNLSRLSDLRDEVGKQLNRLQRQAAAARRYRKLKTQLRELEASLLSLRWRSLEQETSVGLQALGKQETALQESIAGQRAAEAALEGIHQRQGQCSEKFAEVQGELYEVGGEIARLEQAIEHERELKARQQQEFEETGAALNDLEKHMALDRAHIEELAQALAEVEPALANAVAEEQRANESMTQADTEIQAWQAEFEAHHPVSSECQREADLRRAEAVNLDQRALESSRRLELLGKETESVDTSQIVAALQGLGAEAAKLALAETVKQQELDVLRTEITRRQDGLRECESAVQQRQRDLHTREGRLESLMALQNAALAGEASVDWLKAHGLYMAPRLAKAIKVAGGWETALETVLGQWLQSITASGNEARIKALAVAEDSRVDLVDEISGGVSAKAGTLAIHVRAPDAVMTWLNRVRLADSLEQAWRDRGQLGEAESFITPAGEWLGRGWLRIARGKAGEDGMLTREKAMAELHADIAALQTEVEGQLEKNETERQSLDALQVKLQEVQLEVNTVHRRYSEVHGQVQSRRSSMQLMDGRQQAIARETAELQQQLEHDQRTLREVRSHLDELLENMAGLKLERDRLDQRRTGLLSRRDAARSALQQAREQRHELALKAEARRASLDSLRQSLQRMDTQLSQMQQRYLNLSEQVAQAEHPAQDHSAEMNVLLQRRLETEQRLGQAREALTGLEAQYREQDASRHAAVQKSDEIRQQLEHLRLQQQELELNARALERQVEQLGGDVQALQESLPADANTGQWETEMASLAEAITRLEPVNLAAIDEFEEEQKRKQYLDAQNDDLCQALATLEEAIAKIDRKTRTRFKETFEQVNKGMAELFPRLFGGGHAYLELTGEDLLTAGVGIMARPPGKRVSNIHLLSGGEKALTAVAFVFAIFQLNPSPFCLLDEVDAPLDDSNVARFSGMVRELSETVQFIFVTHNKITMEMAHQMSGVTMREPGVSRLVQVDIDEAARLAGSQDQRLAR
ncbi:MAG TPA: chromosome segregation protein SMC, partial [Xanthomonadales bacterium]|nr:chromosome segregation protein SMC [Xanthomonadales bacterium]